MIIPMETSASGGGSNIKSGTLEIDSTMLGTEYEIDTGLGNNLKRFVGIVALPSNTAPLYVGLLGYDAENSNVAGCSVYSSNAYGKNNYLTTSMGTYNGIKSVSNGVITIMFSSRDIYAGVGHTLYWYAE